MHAMVTVVDLLFARTLLLVITLLLASLLGELGAELKMFLESMLMFNNSPFGFKK
ncbi:UNVERIFIED_CONTAM: hypothetical protein GTU68_009479 [Idotea baltica]|nr:hypothetical protein [Idotea baltica]